MVHKSHYDPAKEKWREAWYQFVRKHRHSLRRSPQDWQVVFFPGEEALEVDVYDRLKIPRENLLGLERDPKVHEKLRKKKLGIRLTDEPVDALDYFRQSDEKFEIINLDYAGTLNLNVARTLAFIVSRQILHENAFFGVTLYGKREQDITKKMYYTQFGLPETDNLRLFFGNSPVPQKLSRREMDRLRDLGITGIITGALLSGCDLLNVNPIFERNPQFSEIESIAERDFKNLGFEIKNASDFHRTEFWYKRHHEALIQHLLQQGIADDVNWAGCLANMTLEYYTKSYFIGDAIKYSYVSRGSSRMVSDFIVAKQYNYVFDRYRYLAEHAYVDLDQREFLLSVRQANGARDLNGVLDLLFKDAKLIVRVGEHQISIGNGPRIGLGSSAKLPKLAGEEYYRQRYADVEKGVALPETWDRLMREYKVRRSQLPRFEAHYTMMTHGPQAIPRETNGNSGVVQNLEARIDHDKFELIPHQYWDRLPEPFRQRVKYFIEEDIRKADLTPQQQQELIGEVRTSKWYKNLNGHQLINSQFYAFFDDILLELVAGNVPNRKKIQEMFEDVMKPDWREKGISKVKPLLALSDYERLSFYEGKSDEWILDRYSTPKPNSVRAYKAWVTMRHGEKKQKDNIGSRVAVLIRQRKTKEQIMEEIGVSDYQFRGFLAAYNRGAYKNLFREQLPATPQPRIYVDSHGIVHVNPRNAGDIERGYK